MGDGDGYGFLSLRGPRINLSEMSGTAIQENLNDFYRVSLPLRNDDKCTLSSSRLGLDLGDFLSLLTLNSFKLFFNQGGRAVRDMLPDAASISSLLESRLLTSNFPVQ